MSVIELEQAPAYWVERALMLYRARRDGLADRAERERLKAGG